MEWFKNIDIRDLFDNESEYARKHTFDEITDERIKRAEKYIGYKLPESYIALLKIQNGGVISDKYDNSWLSVIYGIGAESSTYSGLEDMFDNWKEWEYPDIGIPFGETQSAGHDMYYMDYSVTDENGEPRIVLIDNEMDNEITFVADNLEEFIKIIIKNENPFE